MHKIVFSRYRHSMGAETCRIVHGRAPSLPVIPWHLPFEPSMEIPCQLYSCRNTPIEFRLNFVSAGGNVYFKAPICIKQKKCYSYQLERRLDGLHIRSGRCKREKNLFYLPEIRPRFLIAKRIIVCILTELHRPYTLCDSL